MNATLGALKLLEALCEEEPSSFQWQHLREMEEAPNLKRLLALRICCATPAMPARSGARLANSHHSVAVEFRGNGVYRAYCHDVGFFGVEPEDLRVLELDLRHWSTSSPVGSGSRPLISAEEVVPRLLYQVGSPKFGPYRTRIYFARCLDRVRCFRSGPFSFGTAPRPHPGHPGFDHILAADPSSTCPHGTRSSRCRMWPSCVASGSSSMRMRS